MVRRFIATPCGSDPAGVPQFIPLIQEEPRVFSLAGMPQPPQHTIGVGMPGQIALQELTRLYVDSAGVERGVYVIVGFAGSMVEAYPWLAGRGSE